MEKINYAPESIIGIFTERKAKMRLWTISARYLDAKGLVAAWREGLLALKVLRGETRGYRNHPQLERFRSAPDPVGVARRYLEALAAEADVRGYRFDRSRLGPETGGNHEPISVASGQIDYELKLLLHKLETRDPSRRASIIAETASIALNPVFRAVPGGIASWERVIPEVGAQ